MLPQALAGSYERYKRDTALFTTWLAKTAAACGYKPQVVRRQEPPSAPAKPESIGSPASNTPRLKGKARKAAKDAKIRANIGQQSTAPPKAEATITVRYTMTTRELLAQARAIADSACKSHITMPSSLRTVVERAIRARQRCTEWFRKSKIQNKYSDQQHEHFVKVLGESLVILEPHVDDESLPGQSQRPSKEPKDKVSTKLNQTANRFESLAAEDPIDSDDIQMSEILASVSTAKKTPSSNKEPVIETFELEDESVDEDDLAFRIFCEVAPTLIGNACTDSIQAFLKTCIVSRTSLSIYGQATEPAQLIFV